MTPTLNPALEQILVDLRPAAERLGAARRRRRGLLRVAFPTTVVVAAASSAALAAGLIGSPAPESVKRDLREVDAGMPADLRQNADAEHARAAAVSAGSTVYFAPRAGGGYCAEMVTGGRARGVVCSDAAESARRPISVTVPFTDPVTDRSPVSVSGHVSAPGAAAVQLVYPDGGSDAVDVSSDGFYVADVPAAHLKAVHEHGLLLVARSAGGDHLAQTVVPDDAITPQNDRTPPDPIETDLLSDGSDFTKLLGVRGRVTIAGVARLELRYPDGAAVDVPLHGDRFRIDFPAGRRDDFAHAAGKLIAYDAGGRRVASRAVYSVAGWERARGG